MKVPAHDIALACVRLCLRRGEWRTGTVTEVRTVPMTIHGDALAVAFEVHYATRDDLRAP